MKHRPDIREALDRLIKKGVFAFKEISTLKSTVANPNNLWAILIRILHNIDAKVDKPQAGHRATI